MKSRKNPYFIKKLGLSLLLGTSLISLNTHAALTIRSYVKGLFQFYESNRVKEIGNYITPDLAVISFNLLKNGLLKNQEQFKLSPILLTFLTQLQQQQTENLTQASPAQKTNADFLAILVKLIDPKNPIALSPRAQKEIQLINEAKTIQSSPLWNHPIDYSQLKVRGHYSQNATLSAYFKTTKYANMILLPFVASKATQVSEAQRQQFIQQAAELSQLIKKDEKLQKLYQTLNQNLTWSVGRAEDFTPLSFQAALKQCPKQQANCLVEYAKQNQLMPKIIAQPVELSGLEQGQTATDVLIGFRLLPSRYNLDADLQQNLVFQKPGTLTYLGTQNPFSMSIINGVKVKGYPLMDELMALAGSSQAKQILIEEINYKDYAKYQQKNQQIFKQALKQQDANAAEWRFTQKVLKQNNQDDKALTLMRVHHTWRRYQQQLYAKQSYTPTYKSMPPLDTRKEAAIQPATALYQALAELIQVYYQQTKENKWQWLLEEVNKLTKISIKADKGSALSKEDKYYLNSLDLALKSIVGAKDQPIVVDVHTNAADKMVLEEATGWVKPVEQGELRGATLTQVEFKQPLAERLTDEAWRKEIQQPTR